jgi:hypothetical protein
MLLDRALSTTLRNFSTFFLVIALVTIPLNLAWAGLFRDVIATREIHAEIRTLPPEDRVEGVNGDDIDRARYAQWLVLALELALIPLMLRAFRGVIERDQAGHVPTTWGAWRGVGRKPAERPSSWRPSLILAMAAIALVVWLLGAAIGALLAAPVPEARAWLVVGLMRGAALALALPFLLVGWIKGRDRP